jgi:hypothetical protein
VIDHTDQSPPKSPRCGLTPGWEGGRGWEVKVIYLKRLNLARLDLILGYVFLTFSPLSVSFCVMIPTVCFYYFFVFLTL